MKEKNLKYRKNSKSSELPVWNLNDLYTSIKSKELTKDIEFIRKNTKSFEKKYQNKIKNLNSVALHKAIVDLEKIDEKIDKILSFAHLLLSEDINNQKNKIFFQEMQEKITQFYSSIIFFGLELNQINEKKINLLVKNSLLSKYKTWIKNKRSFKAYQLISMLKN